MKHPSRKPKKRRILPWIILAVACVSAVELFACRIYEPALFDRITAPARNACQMVAATASQWGASLADFAADVAAELSKPPEKDDSLDNQQASEPALGSGDALSDPAATELTSRGDTQYLTGGAADIIYYNQVDPIWASGSYGTDPFAGYGCGPTAMAMVVSSLTDQKITPTAMAQWAVENKHWAPRSGSYLSLVQGASAAFGLNAQPYRLDDPDALRLELATGHIFVALMTTGHFTNSGHFILLRGVTLDGSILVADPSSNERSLTTWDAQLILDELSHSRNDGAPLWLITKPESEK